MLWRKWLLRTFLLLVLAAGGGGYYFYQQATDPETIRQAALTALGERFPGAHVQLESASLRFFGGIQLRELRLARKETPTDAPFAYLPEVTLVHDKQALSQGQLVIRKIQVNRPKLSAVRTADDKWNIAGIYAPSKEPGPIPAIDIQDATITLHDQKAGGEPVELTRVSLSLLPEPNGSTARVQVKGQNAQTGEFALGGTIDLDTGSATVVFRLPRVPLTPELRERVARYAPEIKEEDIQVDGAAAVTGDCVYSPGAERPLSFAVRVETKNSTWKHPKLPFPIEKANVIARLEKRRLIVERFDGEAGGSAVSFAGQFEFPVSDADFNAKINVERLNIRKDLYSALPPQLQKLCHDFSPEGPLSLNGEVSQRDGQLHTAFTVRLHNMAIEFDDFPYPAKNMSGALTYDESSGRPEIQVNLHGTASDKPVKITGKVFGEGLRPNNKLKPGFEIKLVGDDLPIDETVFAALKPHPDTYRVARDFKPAGFVNFVAEIQRRPMTQEGVFFKPEKHLVLKFHDAHMTYKEFPYPVEQLKGTLEVFRDQSWKFYDFSGVHHGGRFWGVGQMTPKPTGDVLALTIWGENALLDKEMEAALTSEMKNAWDLFHPTGRVDFEAKVRMIGDEKPDLDLNVTAKGCNMKPDCFPYQLNQVKGKFRYFHNHITLNEFSARHGDAKITLGMNGDGGEVWLRPRGGYLAKLRVLKAEPITVDEEFLVALPPLVRKVFAQLQPDKPVRIQTDLLELDSDAEDLPTKYKFDGHVAFADCKLQCGVELLNVTGLVAIKGSYLGRIEANGNIELQHATLADLPFTNIRGKINITDDSIELPGIMADLFGGQVYGPMKIRMADTVYYHVDLNGSELDLQQFAKESLGRQQQVVGKAKAKFVISGKGDDLKSLKGNGNIEARGKLYDLPLIFNLLTALRGRLPQGAAFEEANADFTIDGEHMLITRLDLLGNALNLRGSGSVKVDGSDLHLKMHGLFFGRALPPLAPLLDRVPPEIMSALMQVKIDGSLKDVQIKTEPVPVLVEPAKDLIRFLRGRRPS